VTGWEVNPDDRVAADLTTLVDQAKPDGKKCKKAIKILEQVVRL